MRIALRLARRGHTSPNPMVGAVVVKDGEIVGKGYHHRAGEPHAEVFALADAGARAEQATLYVTLEPCCHQGRTPPCVEAVLRSRVRRVVAAMHDPNPKVSGRGIDALRAAGVEVTAGVLETDARDLNKAYIKHITTGLPFVTLKMAMTLDGKIATRTGDSKWVSGEESRRLAHRMRSHADAVVVGAGTALQDDPLLTARTGRGRHEPLRVIVDELGVLPADARVLQARGGDVVIATTRRAKQDALRKLEAAGARILILKERDGLVDLESVFLALGEMGITSAILEGGGELNASALEAKLVDKVVMFIAPKIVGGRSAKTPVEGEGVTTMIEALSLVDVRTRRCGQDLVITARFSMEET